MLNAKKPDNLLIKFQIMSLRILKCEFDVAKMQKTKLKMMSKFSLSEILDKFRRSTDMMNVS